MGSVKFFVTEAFKDGIRAQGHPQCGLVAGYGIAQKMLEMKSRTVLL